jgi:hypothetical protein
MPFNIFFDVLNGKEKSLSVDKINQNVFGWYKTSTITKELTKIIKEYP